MPSASPKKNYVPTVGTEGSEPVLSKLSDLLNECICSIDGLKDYISLTDESKAELEDIIKRYPIRITPYYLSLIDRNDPNDPVRKLCIPEYSEHLKDGLEDTSDEAGNTVVKGMQHKYKQTVLILSTNNCATYCRHCFRKRMVGYCADEVAENLDKMSEYVSSHKEINNILVSGGDAFANENHIIQKYLETFSAIDNISLIRFGSRVPVVMPQRIYDDDELLSLLRSYDGKTQLAVVTQFNHPKELTTEAKRAVRVLIDCGVYVRNQAVLLKGVNDDPKVMADLMNGLVSSGVIPYYVFQCRPVLGVKNQFQIPLMKGEEILRKAKNMMNGQARSYRYVLSHPTGKIEIIGPDSDGMIFKYHEAKEDKDQGRIFRLSLNSDKCWIDPEDL